MLPSVHGISQAGILEWVAIFFSKCSEVGLLNRMAVLFLIFEEASCCLPYQLCHIASLLSVFQVPGSPHPRQHGLSHAPLFLIVALLPGVRWRLTVVLICVCLMVSDAEHLFMLLLAACMSSLEKCLFKSSSHFIIGWCVSFLFLSYWIVGVPYVFWRLTPYSIHIMLYLWWS